MRNGPWSHCCVLASFVMIVLVPNAKATNYLVVTGSYEDQAKAQTIAATKGGWVLDTNLYPGIPENHFLVVRGPFRVKSDATEVLDLLKTAGYQGVHLRAIGAPRIQERVGKAGLPSDLLAVLLGEISIEVQEQRGGQNPCEPDEAYKQLILTAMTLQVDQTGNQKTIEPVRHKVDLGGLWIINRTGEIQRMRLCTE